LDVERFDRAIDLAIARNYFAPEEVLLLSSFPPGRQGSAFVRFWSPKETFIKATGEGPSRPLDSFAFSLEPVRIAFDPERDNRAGRDDPADCRFWDWHPAKSGSGSRAMGLAFRRTTAARNAGNRCASG
jgi:phosphopantetheinyl transferase